MQFLLYNFFRKVSNSLLVAFLLLSFSSCEKVIDLNLNEAEKKYVIEAVITDELNTGLVKITQTKNFDENNTFPGISGAVVSVTENGGATTIFPETSAGVYEQPAFTAVSGKTYTLSVTIATESFSASCRMPQKINLDSVFITDEFLFTDTRKIANTIYQDPVGRGNSYRFVQYINGLKEKQILIQNDEYTDGRLVTAKLFYFADDEDEETRIKSGDEVKIEMLCIDIPVYKYWFSLARSATGSSGQATPSNPVSNLQGGALGYFSAHTYQSRSIIVP